MGIFIPTPQQHLEQMYRAIRKFEFQTKYVLPGLMMLCLVGVLFFPETEMKWLCVGLIVFLGLMIALLRKYLLPRLRRRVEDFATKINS